MTIKQCVSWWCYNNSGIAPDDLMRTFAEIGYQGVELLPEEYFQLAHDSGLDIVTINGHTPLEVGVNKRENFANIKKMVEERLQWAQQWNIPKLIVFSGNRNGQSDEEGLAISIENLSQLAPLAEEAGITLILELLNSKVDHPDYMSDKKVWGVEVCKQVNSPNLKLLYDIYHMQIMEGDIIQTIRTHHPHIGHYHTAGVPGRHEIDDTQELNYPPIVRAILETGYTDYLGQEFVPKGDAKKALAQAYQICNVT
jgi:hydroxypyruvate isomerase